MTLSLDHHLERTLRTLRLSGIADSLEVRLDQARSSSLGYMDFLHTILQDEVERRKARSLQRRIKQAHFNEQKALEDFDFSALPGVNHKQIKDLATGIYIEKTENIILYGPPGTGKTHLAQALGNQACRSDHTVRFITASKLYRQFAQARIHNDHANAMKEVLKPKLLIIDDFGLSSLEHEQAHDLYEVVAERHNRGSIIITSNRPPGDWLDLFPDPVMANSLMDRLAHRAHHIAMKGESFRKRLSPERRNQQ
ncbi:IS21-like element helper ATPase IstB [Desulfurispira natronophila]|uniref:DNA replication protein DnaC n=1 Tax=Desulfurispira natronophila TaxID=682562 RepID=A0A7W8DHQ6_9BACT|nr:IS21-like element helper ATPase IstB [Desulfurispira natronophila]MBB5022831.1 DNA replication protein DnaC [Desulfurispira natronophila]